MLTSPVVRFPLFSGTLLAVCLTYLIEVIWNWTPVSVVRKMYIMKTKVESQFYLESRSRCSHVHVEEREVWMMMEFVKLKLILKINLSIYYISHIYIRM